MQLGLPMVAGDHEEDVMLFGFPIVLEVADVGADLFADSVQGLGGSIPLQVEDDPGSCDQIDARAVRCRNRTLVLLGRPTALRTDVLLTEPDEQTLLWMLAAFAGHTYKELVGLQVVDRMPAVVASIVTALDICAGLIAMQVGEDARSPLRDEDQGVTTPDAGRLDEQPAVDQPVIAESLEAHLAGADAGEEELFDLESV
ncbi:MAG TPA: hypothetical protein VNG93_04540 [Candidatus Dormibacteraeota bacterium]|nr:hypothetical protein [Candidatus Dormibacteraeota bacterium]